MKERDRNTGIMIVVVADDEDYDSDHITTIIIIVTRNGVALHTIIIRSVHHRYFF